MHKPSINIPLIEILNILLVSAFLIPPLSFLMPVAHVLGWIAFIVLVFSNLFLGVAVYFVIKHIKKWEVTINSPKENWTGILKIFNQVFFLAASWYVGWHYLSAMMIFLTILVFIFIRILKTKFLQLAGVAQG